jgi:CubicO group peptidase (beta-lactamase class C family)
LAYHGLTQGYLVGEVIRRVTSRSIGTFFADEVARVLGADFHIGTPPEVDSRIALVIPPATSPEDALDPASLAYRAVTNPPIPPETPWSDDWRRAEIPAANGHGNARSVALSQAAVSCGAGGLLSDITCRSIFETQAEATDLVTTTAQRSWLQDEPGRTADSGN